MKAKIIMHLDMNSYFASVEQQANPFLRNKSVGVCSYLSPRGVIIASSREAKIRGIKTGTKVYEAKTLDPEVILLENDPPKYRDTTAKIFKILADYSNKIEHYSIDEAFLDLTGYVKNFKDAYLLARKVQTRIFEEVGEWMACSVGISWTKFLAKFASDIAPEKSILLINSRAKLEKEFKSHRLLDIWGINIHTEKRLKLLGIYDLIMLKNYPREKIRKALGINGYYLWANLNGFEIAKIKVSSPLPKSISHSCSIPNKTKNQDYIHKVIYKLSEKTGRRLRSKKLEARRVACSLTYINGTTLSFSFKTADKLFTTEEIFNEIKRELLTHKILFKVRIVNVSVNLLTKVTNQLSFFNDRASKRNLSQAMDIINNKYGEYTVIKGNMFNTKDIARDRIGFRKLK